MNKIIDHNNNLYIIEIASRLSGGFFSTITIPLVYRINLIEKAILLSLGQKPTPPPTQLKNYCFQANRFFFPEPGIVKKIIKPNVKSLPKYVKYFEVNVKIGDEITPIANHPMRKGSVLVTGKTRNEAISHAKRIRDLVKLETIPI